ncbi:MAG: exodeoxyribonuclease VII large subunit [Lachnospiraceae bacterium]|nr:exodeoxyribonuclease VII large subunit [Lachnospiraceae bacterium]
MNSVLTVTQVNTYIGNKLSYDPNLSDISVRGEVSNCKYSSTGHIYFSIKDENSQLSCIMFRNRLNTGGLKFRLENGQAVIVHGSINVYTLGGTYSILAESIEKEGAGELFERFEKLKEKLSDEGLFDEEHKKPIPKYIHTLGVVTSKNGAVLHDICTVTARRNPYIKIILADASVQGKGAASSLVAGLKAMIKRKPDVIIIGRGGGSFEDLFEFNDEALARAIYACPIPVISAVGHETDFTICDFVADIRAATPSVAAELAVFDHYDFESRLVDYEYALYDRMISKINEALNRCEQFRLKLDRLDPKKVLKGYGLQLPQYKRRLTLELTRKLNICKQQLEYGTLELQNEIKKKLEETEARTDGYSMKFPELFRTRLYEAKHRMELVSERLDGMSPLKKLQSGYAYLEDEDRHCIRSVKELKEGDTFKATLSDGGFISRVEKIYFIRRNDNGWEKQ